jgi:hypothetical protein
MASANTARSYAKVRFSGRVGGVLIGVSPQPGGEALDVRSIRWQITSGNALQLVLIDSNGGQFRLGPYHPAIAHHALAYAADGRVVTSTLPQPQQSQSDNIQLNARRVVVHPALEDTAFACPAIQVDRFVDAFSHGDSAGASKNSIDLARNGVTSLGWLLTQGPSLNPATQGRLVQAIRDIEQHAQSCGPGTNCFPIEAYVKYRLDFGAAPEFLNCLSRKQEASVCFKALMSRRASSTYLVDSGVREVPFRLDRKFRFLTTADSPNDRLWPLDFMIQAVPQTLTEQDVEVGENWEPWRFPNIDRSIKEAVARGIAGDKNAREVFERMRDFTILQRLFRLALAGDLGAEFPLDELVKLQRATATFVKVERSERWNVNRPLFETMVKERDGLKSILKRIASDTNATEACRSTARKTIESDDKSPWPKFTGLWSSIGEVETVCKGGIASADLARRLALLRRYDLIDEAINLTRDDPGRRGQFSCSPL